MEERSTVSGSGGAPQGEPPGGPPVAPCRVAAVVVTCNPDIQRFTRLLAATLPQVDHTIVVDNGSSLPIAPLLAPWPPGTCELLPLAANIGLAAAQNMGIERALHLGAGFVLLLDHDSIPSPTMVGELLAALQYAAQASHQRPVAAVGPTSIDDRRRPASASLPAGGCAARCGPVQQTTGHGGSAPAAEVDFLIASGMLIPAAVLRRIGAMRGEYFIDHLDREWCFRALAAGYRLLKVPASTLAHQLGDTVQPVVFFAGTHVTWHPPWRQYYLFRNALLMWRDVPIPLSWRVYLVARLLRYFAGVVVLARERRQRLRAIGAGLIHGWRDVRGRYDPATGRCSDVPTTPLDP